MGAVTYVASASAIDRRLKPFRWYKTLVLEGAQEHGVPAAYIEANIANVPTED
jgi:hypothetical protein